MTDRHDVLVQLAEQYKAQTGITVDFQLFAPSDIYSQKVIAAAQAHILPDIFGILDKKSVFADFIKGGFVANLKPYFEENGREWENSFFEKALEGNRFSANNAYGVAEGIYAAPLDVMNIQMVYNKKLLEKAGVVSPPKTFDEFLRAAEALNKIGITPFVSGWAELWLLDCFASNYAFNIMGIDKIMATYRGEVLYTDPDWVKVFEIFSVMAQKNILASGIVTKSNKFAEQDFALERAAFAFNGSWCVNVYHGMNPDLDYGVMLPPKISDGHPLMIWGGAGGSLVVNETSPRKEKAVAFLKWLTSQDQQAVLSEATRNLPSNRNALADLPKELADFGQAMDVVTHQTVWPIEEDAVVKEKFTKGLQSIIIGERTPQEVAREVQEIKKRQMERAIRRAQ
jgi:ABC-type glycerol-3-phosphate transport system substrate-binding protein